MTTDILLFLNKHCSDFLRTFLQSTCGFELLDGERLYIKGKEVPFSELGDKTLQSIYNRLLSAKKKSGYNPAPKELKGDYDKLLEAVQDEYNKQEQEREANRIRSELYSSIQNTSVIYNSLAETIIGSIDSFSKEMLNVISRKIKPDGYLSYENYKILSSLFNKDISLNSLEFYSAESEEALRLWQERLIELSNNSKEIDIFSLTPSAILFLLKSRHITISDAVKYFLQKEYVSWDDIRGLVAILLADKSQFKDLSLLIERCDDGLTSLLEEFNADEVSQFAEFLKKKGVELSGLPTQTVNSLYALGVVSIDSVVSFYLSKEGYTSWSFHQLPFQWEEIKEIIHALLSSPSHFDDLSTLIERCDGLENLLEEFEGDELKDYASYLLKKGIDITKQAPIVINTLFNLGGIPQSSVVEYYLHNAPSGSAYWDNIEDLVSILLSDESQYENLWALINRDSHGLSHLFETFEVVELLPFMEFLRGKGMSLIDICRQIPQQEREELLRMEIEEGTPLDHETIIRDYFDNCGINVSLDLYAFLFFKNCYFRNILSAFRRDLQYVDRTSKLKLRACATQTKAWEIANEIITASLNKY